MAQLKDTQINGNLNVTEDIQIGNTSLSDVIDDVNTYVQKLDTSNFVRKGSKAGIDLNTLKGENSAGIYWVNNGTTDLNFPSGYTWGILLFLVTLLRIV